MITPRRRFLGSSLVLLGGALTDALATPLWRWKHPLTVEAVETKPGNLGIRFVDVAQTAGLNVTNVWGGIDHKRSIIETKGSGLAFFDFDNDGWLDIYLTNGNRLDTTWPAGKAPTSHLFKNNRDGTFTDVTEHSGLGITGWQTGVCVGDYNNDGFDDLFCCFLGHNRLLHNNGNGTFTDVTRKAGLYQEQGRWGAGCSFLDYDRDGHLDLFVCNYIKIDPDKIPPANETHYCQWKGVPILCGPRGLPPDTNILYHNNGDGTFTDVSAKSGILAPGPRYSITSVSYDFDNDGWPDIYIAVDSMPSVLFKNNHDGTFTDIAVMAGCAYNEDGHEQAGMGVAVADYDCDGFFDIFKTNFVDDTCNLYHNNGDGTFTDVSAPSGVGVNNRYVAWGCGFLDFDNDGWADLIQVNGHVYPEVDRYNFGETYKNPRIAYRNLGNGRFKDVSAELGPGISERFSSRGAAFGDYNNNGCMDALVLNLNDPPSLLRNEGGSNKQNWIKIKLIGTHCNRTAIGARVRVITGKHIQMDEVASGGSVMSQNDLRLHFGLGKADTVDMIEIKWPTTQKLEHFPHIKANQILTIREGEGIIKSDKPSTKA
ncbi:CRTAC1 family protein [Granulicella sp. 5B5]|uniref:CRTAC1 family protein n=1 Tax=Granulicella sp. 5B5 TaxID=1617967 RepID=UPI0015F57B14|nr:CRTAC1 family protein [Granulicella sp. 5B5]QMV18997.1 CRTAC1 family protein [Granulicella sp. 5B5]